MSKPPAVSRWGYLCVITAAVLWAVSGSSGKFLFQQGMTPMQLVQIRVTLASGLLFLWLLLRQRDLAAEPRNPMAFRFCTVKARYR